MMYRLLLSMVILIAGAFGLSAGVQAQELAKPAGTVTSVKGPATVARASLPQPNPVRFKDAVYRGDLISTGEDALVRLLLGGKALVTVR